MKPPISYYGGLTCEDNMLLMARYPDKYFELAIVDPPYGVVDQWITGGNKCQTKNRPVFLDDKKMKEWDIKPSKEYFDELFRVSKNQIIFGGNNFELPPTRGFIIWDKGTTAPSFAQYDYLWTSFNALPKLCDVRLLKGFLKEMPKIHPTQKPIALYKWLLLNRAKIGDKILDTHLGGGSIAIACLDMGFELTGCELDTEYYLKMIDRIESHKIQLQIL